MSAFSEFCFFRFRLSFGASFARLLDSSNAILRNTRPSKMYWDPMIWKHCFFIFFDVIVINRGGWTTCMRQVFDDLTTISECFVPHKYFFGEKVDYPKHFSQKLFKKLKSKTTHQVIVWYNILKTLSTQSLNWSRKSIKALPKCLTVKQYNANYPFYCSLTNA